MWFSSAASSSIRFLSSSQTMNLESHYAKGRKGEGGMGLFFAHHRNSYNFENDFLGIVLSSSLVFFGGTAVSILSPFFGPSVVLAMPACFKQKVSTVEQVWLPSHTAAGRAGPRQSHLHAHFTYVVAPLYTAHSPPFSKIIASSPEPKAP